MSAIRNSTAVSYAGDKAYSVYLPCGPNILSTTVTTGIIASVQPVDITQVASFAARFGSTFDEYRIVGADVVVNAIGINPGIARCFFDEKNATAPVAVDAFERKNRQVYMNTAAPGSTLVMRYRATDLADLSFTAIGTTVTPIYFKVYTNNAQFGSNIVASQALLVSVNLHLEFRGLKAV